MPNANKVLYAGWAPERYLVKVDADGGQMDLGGTFSTYFRINYNEMVDEYAGIYRNYIEDPEGIYVYLDFSYDKLTEMAASEPDSLGEAGQLALPGALRKSFYYQYAALETLWSSDITVGDETFRYSSYIKRGCEKTPPKNRRNRTTTTPLSKLKNS